MTSQWLQGSIRHRRRYPVQHQFEYNTGMLALDTDEWHQIANVSPFFSLERFNWVSLKRKDYFQPEAGTLSSAVRSHVETATGWHPDGPVELITHPRYAGYVFNPVSFYFCYRAGQSGANGDIPAVILAQITNTPWNERHVYCLETTASEANAAGWRTEKFAFAKRFHVSPFNAMAQHYEWTFSFRGPELRIHMNVLEEGKKHFDATLVVQRTPLTRTTLHKSLRQFPVEAIKVAAGIYWHALKLKIKGAPFYTHPDKLAESDQAHRLGSGDEGADVTRSDKSNKSRGKVSSWRT